jgi:hypothetical protein
MNELPLIREMFGFRRTECACERCQVYCRHMPGTLDPSDLPSLCGEGQDSFVWAEQHLRALIDQPYPTLVPARNNLGHCHWHFDGKCAVHDKAPYSCAFFDAHMSDTEVARRVAATVQACKDDAAANGLYYRIWLHLRGKGMLGQRGDRAALLAEVRRMDRQTRRSRRRIQES